MTPIAVQSPRHSARPLALVARILGIVLLAIAVAAPAAAQVNIRKKLRSAAGAEQAQPAATGTAAGETGGTLVLDDEVVTRLLKGLRAGKAYRESAAKGNTPYGRHLQAVAAYAEAKQKCDAGGQTLSQRMVADPKLGERNTVYLDRMIAAQQKGDTAAQRAWGDSMAALIDPACTVKSPQQPNDWWDQKSEVDRKAEEAELEAAGFERRELGEAKDRAIAIIHDAPPPDVSPSEQQAVEKQENELKELMNLNPPAPTPAPTPAPAVAAAPASQAAAGPTSDQQAAAECMGRNTKKNEKEIERVTAKLNAAAQANDMEQMMALADSIQKLQMGGCTQ